MKMYFLLRDKSLHTLIGMAVYCSLKYDRPEISQVRCDYLSGHSL